MQKVLIITLILLFGNLFSQKTFGQGKDERLIKNINEFGESVVKLDSFYSKNSTTLKKEWLGFGYWIRKSRINGSHMSIDCDFYFLKDSVVSYVLKPQLPLRKRKRKKYLEWFNDKFEVTDDFNLLPKYYNYEILQSPLKAYKGDLIIDDQIGLYMSPESGLNYGGRGGFSMRLLKNRALFIVLADRLTTDLVIQLMYSKNPASRLTEIQYKVD